jgi:hypothetical protein
MFLVKPTKILKSGDYSWQPRHKPSPNTSVSRKNTMIQTTTDHKKFVEIMRITKSKYNLKKKMMRRVNIALNPVCTQDEPITDQSY